MFVKEVFIKLTKNLVETFYKTKIIHVNYFINLINF